MGHHTATVVWERGVVPFVDRRYPRRHLMRFDGGAEVPGSASPQVLAPPLSDPSAVDPEEAFVASLAACHMLWFLDIACRAGWLVDRYEDEAAGVLDRDADGRLAMTRVTLRPQVAFGGSRRPDPGEVARLHHAAHAECFIANSVKSVVVVEPR